VERERAGSVLWLALGTEARAIAVPEDSGGGASDRNLTFSVIYAGISRKSPNTSPNSVEDKGERLRMCLIASPPSSPPHSWQVGTGAAASGPGSRGGLSPRTSRCATPTPPHPPTFRRFFRRRVPRRPARRAVSEFRWRQGQTAGSWGASADRTTWPLTTCARAEGAPD
jgi:hypothetical protein